MFESPTVLATGWHDTSVQVHPVPLRLKTASTTGPGVRLQLPLVHRYLFGRHDGLRSA
jgi:hypothetical protein